MGEYTLESILTSATRLFAKRGMTAVTIQDIADDAGVAAGTIIYHFKSKNNLLFILARDILHRLHVSAKAAVARASTPLEALHAFIDSFFTFAASDKDCLAFLSRLDPFSSLDLSTFPNADLSLIKDQYMALLVVPLERVASERPFLKIEPGKTALAIWAMLKGIAGLLCESSDVPDLRDEVKAMVAGRLGFGEW